MYKQTLFITLHIRRRKKKKKQTNKQTGKINDVIKFHFNLLVLTKANIEANSVCLSWTLRMMQDKLTSHASIQSNEMESCC